MDSERNPPAAIDENHLPVWAEILKAAAHPTRLSILAQLAHSPRCVTALHELLDVRQTGISQHLSVLKHAGLVAFRRRGASRCYYLPKPQLVEAIFDLLARSYPELNVAEVEERIDRALDARRRNERAAKRRGPSARSNLPAAIRPESRSPTSVQQDALSR